MTNMKKITKLLALVATLSLSCFAQTILTTTTISAAMTNAQKTITLASATGVVPQGLANQINTLVLVDREVMAITTLVSGTTYNVQRGFSGFTRVFAHANGAKVWLGAPVGNFRSTSPVETEVSGACTATNEVSLPLIYSKTSHFYDCLGSQWVLTSSPDYPILGATVASPAGLLTATGTSFKVSGTNAITGINVPNGWAPGMCMALIPSGIFTTTTATNIALASTAVVGKTLFECWDGSKWNPSY